ncbi:MAG: hypothetical protein HY648_10405 [Acidobacteria bacterium]|nr:hypothetical protein [Acidobacteriota bacterium]
MMSHFIRHGLIIHLVLLAGIALASAQQAEAPKATRVILGSTSGPPASPVVVPIYFTPLEGVDVGRLTLTVDFISRNLKFSKIDPGVAAEMGKVDVTAEAKDGKNEEGLETTTLTITASFLQSPPPDKGIPSGLLGYLSLDVNADARPATINLRAAAEAQDLKTNQPIPIEAASSTVDVLAPGTEPLVVCFIFSH